MQVITLKHKVEKKRYRVENIETGAFAGSYRNLQTAERVAEGYNNLYGFVKYKVSWIVKEERV